MIIFSKILRRTSMLIVFSSWLLTAPAQSLQYDSIFKEAERQTALLLQNIPIAKTTNADQLLPRTVEGGELKMVASRDWTSGFFPGILWYLYEYSKEEKWRQLARVYSNYIEKEKDISRDHDMGFRIYCPFGNALRLDPTEHDKQVIIQAARTLCTRFNPVAGVIKSWSHAKDKWDYPVIIDNMMNLELLFEATILSGDSSFHKIAVTHANTTLKNHFRPDYSSYHVLDYDTVTGQVIKRLTAQGYANESAWARGQSWALYGYTLCYRYTKDLRFLVQAEKIADFILKNDHLPDDKVPYWDFNAPSIPREERDASAAAIMSSALYELGGYSYKRNEYHMRAEEILESLTYKYRSPPGENKGFILLHSVGHKPVKSEVDVPIIYADYYYLEALLRSRRMKK